MRLFTITAIALALCMPKIASSQDEIGALEFVRSCSVCHGIHGRGDASARSLLLVEPPDLTKIAERRDGEFPEEEIADIIDGRGLQGHGPMPVWGYELQQDKMSVAGSETAEILVRDRIKAIVRHLRAIQE